MDHEFRRSRLRGCLLLLALGASAVGCSSGPKAYSGGDEAGTVGGAGTVGRAPLPLDPLTRAERTAAERAALDDPRVQKLLGDDYLLVSMELLADKPASGGTDAAPVRGAELLFSRPATNSGVRVLVHLQQGEVIAVEPLQGHHVPLTSADYNVARELALRSSAVQELFGARLAEPDVEIEMLRERPADPRDPCSRNRCVVLLFRTPQGYLSGPRVVVDLTTRETEIRRERQ